MQEDRVICAYITEKLGVPSQKQYFSPFTIGNFLVCANKIIIDSIKISRNKLINFMILNNIVPIKSTAMFRLVLLSANSMIGINETWTELRHNGRKGYLTSVEVLDLVDIMRNESKGGKSLPSENIIKTINDHIINVWRKKRKNHLLPRKIPRRTLVYYLSVLKAQSVFNIRRNVINKTIARSIAEWSIRSTLAYAVIVMTTHFIPNVKSTIYHPKKKDLSEESLILWEMAERGYNKMVGNIDKKEEMVPVLPNLITTTDEVTIFASTTSINKKDEFYLEAKPEEIKNPSVHSGKRNPYTNTLIGNAHCRGVRIVINSTFTAGGLSAPVFITIFGLTGDEMPANDTITIEIPGLTAGSHQNIYATGSGFITFVRGNYTGKDNGEEDDDSNANNEDNNNDDTNPTTDLHDVPNLSKESKIAQLYRKLVYYPFIKNIRISKYGHSGGDDIPDYLRAVSWMDGCNAQLKLITTAENLEVENKYKITCCKHSAARTALEQAADTSACFKQLKKAVSEAANPNASNSSVYLHINQCLLSLEHNLTSNSSTGRKLKLALHKKKAILFTASKIPIAIHRAYDDHVIKEGFVANGQLDNDSKLVPSLNNLIHTYRGEIKGTCLERKEELVEGMYDEGYKTGIIKESTFDNANVPRDKKPDGESVERCFGITQENRQRAKVLSAKVQIEERIDAIFHKRMATFKKQLQLYENECKEYRTNKECEDTIVDEYKKFVTQQGLDVSNPVLTSNTNVEYCVIANRLTYEIIGTFQSELKAKTIKSFVRVRSEINIRGGGKVTYLAVPNTKSALVTKMIELRTVKPKSRIYPQCPIRPQR